MSSKKDQILDKSLNLFLEKGFDETSITDILNELNIARGTLYYHFESKEAIMDGIINRIAQQIIQEITQVVNHKSLSVYEKFFGLFSKMQLGQMVGGEAMLVYLHQPQNALFHEKSRQMIVKEVSPLLAQIISEGNHQHLFDNPYPQYTAEMILSIIASFTDGFNQDHLGSRIECLLYNFEKMLGTKSGELAKYMEFFQ